MSEFILRRRQYQLQRYHRLQAERVAMRKLAPNRIVCECGGYYLKQNKTNHVRTQKHNRYIKEHSK